MRHLFSGLLRDSVPQLPDQQQGGEPQQRQQRARGGRGGQDGGGDAGHPAGGDQQAGLRHNVNTDIETGAKQHSAEKCQREIAVFPATAQSLLRCMATFSLRLTAVSQSVLSL